MAAEAAAASKLRELRRFLREELLQLHEAAAARASRRTSDQMILPAPESHTRGCAFAVRLARKNGKYGMGHDEHNCVVVVHPDSAAADAGLRVGDAVRSVNGVPLTGLLTAALQGKERVELTLLRKPAEKFARTDLRQVAAAYAADSGTSLAATFIS